MRPIASQGEPEVLGAPEFNKFALCRFAWDPGTLPYAPAGSILELPPVFTGDEPIVGDPEEYGALEGGAPNCDQDPEIRGVYDMGSIVGLLTNPSIDVEDGDDDSEVSLEGPRGTAPRSPRAAAACWVTNSGLPKYGVTWQVQCATGEG